MGHRLGRGIPMVGKDISDLRAQTLSLFEKEGSYQRKLNVFAGSCCLISICKNGHLKKLSKFIVARRCSVACVRN